MYDTCQLLPSSTKTYAGMELHHVAANLDFTGDGSTNAIAYNKLVFGGLSNGLLAYNCALNIGNCTFNNIQRLPTMFMLTDKETYGYKIVDQTGRICYQENNLKNELTRVNTHELIGGIYNFSLTKSNGVVYNNKVVILK